MSTQLVLRAPTSRRQATLPRPAGPRSNWEANLLDQSDRSVHDWYRFVLSFPPHLVRDYVAKFELDSDSLLLDPFCGTGTSLVEAKKRGIRSIGIEANPFAAFAARTKLDWSTSPRKLRSDAREVASSVLRALEKDGVPDSGPGSARKSVSHRNLLSWNEAQERLVLADSLSPRPLHKVLRLVRHLDGRPCDSITEHERLALARSVVLSSSNLRFGPEVGLGRLKDDAPVVEPWLNGVLEMASDLETLDVELNASSTVIDGDSRDPGELLKPASVDAIVTSPPYPNEKDYTRTTRLESVLLGYIRSREDLRRVKTGLVRSNTRGVFKADDDDGWVEGSAEIQRIASEIEARRLELGKTSGFERLYHRVAKLYFGGMHRHLAGLRRCLKPDAHLAYVVGDQASYLRVPIRTGKLLAEIAESLGYELDSIDLFRTRIATATKEQLREEVVVLRWPG